MGNADTSILPVLLGVAAISMMAVTLFLFGIHVGTRLSRGQSPVGLPRLWKPAEKPNGKPANLPRITG